MSGKILRRIGSTMAREIFVPDLKSVPRAPPNSLVCSLGMVISGTLSGNCALGSFLPWKICFICPRVSVSASVGIPLTPFFIPGRGVSLPGGWNPTAGEGVKTTQKKTPHRTTKRAVDNTHVIPLRLKIGFSCISPFVYASFKPGFIRNEISL